MATHIHPTAVVEPGAQIGDNVTIGPLSYVEQDVTIGEGCLIGPQVTILRYSTLGANCKVHSGAVLGDLPQDIDFGGDRSYVRIGADCIIREGVTVHRGTKPESVTEVGDGCFLMVNSHCAHNVKLGKKVILANGALLGGYAEVGDGAFLSGNALVHQFVRLGRLCMMGGGCGVSQDVLPFVTVRSYTPNKLMGLNVVGLRRSGIAPNERKEIKRAYVLLFDSKLATKDAIRQIRDELKTPVAEEMCAFIESSERGFCRG
jgi:UDP-N-acetylglucosamine acyltransferase